MFTDRFSGRFLAIFDRFGLNPAPLTIEASFLVIGRVLALRLISCCKGTTFALRLTNNSRKIFCKYFLYSILMPDGVILVIWSFGQNRFQMSKSATI